MQGMEREESGDEGAFPDFPGHCREEPEQKKRAQDVQNQIGDMIPSGMETVKLVIRHEREPDERVPQAEIFGAEGPDDALRRDAGLNIEIFRNVDKIIEINKARCLTCQ